MNFKFIDNYLQFVITDLIKSSNYHCVESTERQYRHEYTPIGKKWRHACLLSRSLEDLPVEARVQRMACVGRVA